MSDVVWIRVTDTCSTIGLFVSTFGNITLFVLLIRKSVNGIGTYRYLMISFCIFSSIFTSLEKFMRPLMHHYKNTLMVLQRKRFDFSDSVAIILSASYCGCFAMCFVMFAVHFIYRYYVSCQPQKLFHFRGKKLWYWILGMLLVALSWVVTAYIFFEPDEETEYELNIVLSTYYGLSREKIGYVPYAFYKTIDHQRVLRPNTLVGVFHHVVVMQATIYIVFHFGIKTFRRIRNIQAKSVRTKKLQLQLFVALVVQTVIPLFLMYLPNMIFTCSALLGGGIGAWANVTVVMNHLYPAIDPFVILFIIKGFRDTLIGRKN
ncbi:Protein CBR-STR-114 [Caenorhabditis briggsae]|uniref:Serpentine receptor class r-10 n=1 Tax=Caenorhabditis briggsae TaxID=6238 RepID=A8WYV9_CAEBR|nr:Protein CBR-STR-114 [Caenorhabditis briggsae]CAP25567.1 Protein CBR-STR-114 [Caenorhabditis briggsae]